VEPIFATSYKRRVKKNDGYGKSFKEYTDYHPIIESLFGTDKDLPEHVVTAHHIDPYFRVRMQGAIQKYIDSSISSTVNLAEDITVDTIADIYMTAYEAGLKGITVYREGSREGILVTEKDEKTEKMVDSKELSTEMNLDKSPRTRPTQTSGVTRRIRTGEGTLYITINEDVNGLCEVFTTIGKAGGNAAAQSEAISRLISLSLRSGLDPHAIVRQLKGISGPNPTWEDGRLILSTPDAIGKALDDYLSEKKNNTSNNKSDLPNSDKPRITLAQEKLEDIGMMICTECHNHSVTNEGGCLTCRECGWSKCD
jgi:ribonucleoside-diphosphate reductase alpha chain